MWHSYNHLFLNYLPLPPKRLLDSVYFCDALSTGQLPFQAGNPVRIMVVLGLNPTPISGVKLALTMLYELVRSVALA